MERTDTQELNGLSLAGFADFLRDSGFPRRLIELARDEDLSLDPHDWTGELMFGPDERRRVVMRSRESGVAAGLAFVPDLVEAFADPEQIEWELALKDGEPIEPGTVLAEFTGNARTIVRLERTMLNLIARMCSIATLTRSFVTLVEGTKASICDTRKTTPGLRAFEKYAVRCGGGTTHRMGLSDALLIKDNHLAGVEPGDLADRIRSCAHRLQTQDIRVSFVMVEVDTLGQFESMLGVDDGLVDIVLLDNMNPDQLAKAVSLRDASGRTLLLEASGGVNKDTVSAIARTGVDRISIGALTHQAQSLDIGLDAMEE